jgi:iron-sulfur cluster assembly protein
MTLTVTRRAAEAIEQRAREADVAGWLLRVAVVAGGCNGLSYDLYFIPEPSPEDSVVEAGAVRVAVDRRSAELLDGTVIDLPRGGAQSFRFENPRARKACSCGASFEV